MTTRTLAGPAARRAGVLVGALSGASGALMIAAPLPLARLYGLPPHAWLARVLGVRDVAIGVRLLLDPRCQRALRARGYGDALDAFLLLFEAARRRRRRIVTLGRLLVAIASARVALRLASLAARD